MTLRHHRRLPFGAELIAPDRTRFRLWAPSCAGVALAIEGRDKLPMMATGGGRFEIDADCGAGTLYRYRVEPGDGSHGDDCGDDRGDDNTLLVPDPASRAQAGDVHDPSIVIDPESYRWTHDEWRGRAWCETVIYEIHVGLAGGFNGVQRLLPQLALLGITAIELMPVADFAGSRNWGYDGALPFAPETGYGTPDELKALIDAAHGAGLMVFLDVVYNHFGPEGNYLGAYADAFFRDDIKTPWGRAIDFRRAEVRDFFRNNALYWLMEYRIDGLRLDATHSIVPQDWLKDLSMFVLDTVDASRHIHLMIEHEGNAAHLLGPYRGYDAQWNDDGHHVLHVLLTGETDGYYVDFADTPEDKLARCLAEGFVYQGQPSIFRDGATRGEPSKDLPPTAFVLFLQNHDQIGNRACGERLTTLADAAALLAASALVLLAPQIPLLFMGEEWGAAEPFLYFTSYPDEELAAAVREGRRNEFSAARGFGDPEARDTIPDPNAPATFEMSRLDFDRASRDAASDSAGDSKTIASSFTWLAHTSRLLAIRHRFIIPRLEGARSLGAEAVGPAAVVARWHMGDGAVLTIAVNLAALPVAIPAHRFHMRGELIYATRADAHHYPEGFLLGRTTWALLEGPIA